MDSLEFNKVIAAVLVAGMTFQLSGLVGDALVHPTPLAKTVLKIEEPAAASPGKAPAPLPPIANEMAKADPAAGEALTKKVCAACHSFNEGGKNGVGPNLYGVVGRQVASEPGFSYSAALKAKKGPWTFAELNEWLHKPSEYAPGTKMGFAGFTKAQERADVIDYLRTLSPTPMPRPAPVAVAASAPAAAPAASGSGAGAPAPAAPASFAAMVAAADPAEGKKLTLHYACIACHSFNEGGKAGVGPNLYNVVGGPMAHMQGYSYSAALLKKKSETSGVWTVDALNEWLTKPSAYIPGTKMGLAGVPSEKDRAELVAYLHSLSASPVPLTAAGK
jgi:cytochrome c